MTRSAGILLSVLVLAGISVSWLVIASEKPASQIGQVVLPVVIMPVDAQYCVEPVEIMRRYHMDYLMHQRDATVIEGIRTPKYSLTGCIDCHNPRIKNQQPVHYENPQHFCAGCHGFTGVKIDCFDCHADQAAETS